MHPSTRSSIHSFVMPCFYHKQYIVIHEVTGDAILDACVTDCLQLYDYKIIAIF